MDNIENCNPLNIFINNATGLPECLPGVNVAPDGYSQPIPEVTVRPKNWWIKYAVLGVAAYMLIKR